MASEHSPFKNLCGSKVNDVLCGKGSDAYFHSGNSYFRSLISKYKLEYVMGGTQIKANIANRIVNEIKSLNPPGRFLKKRKKNSNALENFGWEDIGEEATISKTRLALRVGANIIKKERNQIRRFFSAIESYSGIEEVPSFNNSYHNYARDDHGNQLPRNTHPIQEFNSFSIQSTFAIQNSNESSIRLRENGIIRYEQMKSEFSNPTTIPTPFDELVPQNSYESSMHAEAFKAHHPTKQKHPLASKVSSSKNSLSNIHRHRTYINTEINPSPLGALHSPLVSEERRALTPVDYSPRHPHEKPTIENTSNKEPNPDAFNSLPFYPIDKINRKKKRKSEFDQSNLPTLCNQNGEEVHIPRSVSLTESFSYHADENEHPREDKWVSKKWKSVSLPQSFTNNIGKNGSVHEPAEENIAPSPQILAGSSSSVYNDDTPETANDAKIAPLAHRGFWPHNHHFNNTRAQPGNMHQHQSYEINQMNHGSLFQEDGTSYYANSGENTYPVKHHFYQHGDVSPVENQIVTKSVSTLHSPLTISQKRRNNNTSTRTDTLKLNSSK